ncbi:MAG TPA: ABC transporter permease [Gammaproteobacteria bacterium]|nr:ABC transporter permease [Gammaproteobacteria bacterium]
MKYFPLIWAGLWRKRVRTVLTLLSVVVAFLLFGGLHGLTAGIDGIVDQMSDTRLRTQSRVNITEALPLAHLPRIESVPGVEGVAYYNWFGGYYQEPSNSVASGAMDVERLDALYPEIEIPREYLDAMARTRNGALIGHDLAAERGWKIGDQIPLVSTVWTRKDGASEWLFEIVGVYGFADGKVPTNELWFNYSYFDEARAFGNGTVTLYFASISDASQAAKISEDIDRQFANSTFETQTQNEKDWIRAQINQIGDINLFLNMIIGAVFFTLLFLTGNTMMQSVRERIPELAVLKTYGFSNFAVTSLVFAEAVLLCGVAAGIGLWIAAAVTPSIYRLLGAGGMPLPTTVIVLGFGLAVLVAVISALPPALRVQRLNIVDALAGR